MSRILDGKKLALEIERKLTQKIKRLKKKPALAIIQVGNVAESNTYIKRKIAFGERIEVRVLHKKFRSSTKEKALISEISALNADPAIHGIIVQLPLPAHINAKSILKSVAEEKRVDGGEYFLPATTRGIISILDRYNIKISGKKAVVIGRSELVGKPTALALLARGATITVCHRHTKNLAVETRKANILVVAVGSPKLIGKKHVSKNQIVIDVGVTVMKNGKLAGDVDFKNVKNIVKAITPVPGGIGPMTVASLFENLLEAHELQT